MIDHASFSNSNPKVCGLAGFRGPASSAKPPIGHRMLLLVALHPAHCCSLVVVAVVMVVYSGYVFLPPPQHHKAQCFGSVWQAEFAVPPVGTLIHGVQQCSAWVRTSMVSSLGHHLFPTQPGSNSTASCSAPRSLHSSGIHSPSSLQL